MKFLRLPLWTFNHSTTHAFTLIECCIVVLLIGLVLFFTGGQSLFLNRIMVRTELEHLYTTCYYLQRKAMITHQPQKLIFDQEHKSYSYDTVRHDLPKSVSFGYPNGARGAPAGQEQFITHPITFINNAILFSPTGVMQAGTVYLCDTAHKYGFALSCAVAQVSYLRKYRYNGTWEQV